MRRLIIDTDTASDDAVALMMAAAAPEITIEAITVVAGNVALPQASQNARFVTELCELTCPVFEGCDRPWLRPPAAADWFHGKDGMGNRHFPAPRRPAESEHAVSALLRLFAAAPGEIELITLGPLTTIATALAQNPELASQIRHCWVMGGAANTVGNVTPAAEYNLWCDPEAAQRVMQSGLPVTLLGWELSRGAANLSDAEIAEITALGTERAQVAMNCNLFALEAVRRLQKEAGMALADPVAMAVALEPAIAREQGHFHVQIACDDTLTRGMSVVDQLGVTGQAPNAHVVTRIDVAAWKRVLKRSLGP